MGVRQYPHYLFYAAEDGTPQRLISTCREETNGAGAEIQIAGGTFVRYSSLIQIPRKSIVVKEGSKVLVSESDNGLSDIRIVGKVLNFDKGQLHHRIWLEETQIERYENGFVEFKVKSAGGIDHDTGYPKAAQIDWLAPIKCQYVKLLENKLAESQGGSNYTSISYTVLIKRGFRRPPHIEQVRLKDQYHNTIGEFQVQRTDDLEGDGLFKIELV